MAVRVVEADFPGTDRFEIVRRLGAGGMGVVYEALDREDGSHVALKTLRTFDARTILLFKKEFRALEGLHHPNLVQLGDLVEERGHWFFTMELVRGVDFLSYVRPLGYKTEDEPTSVAVARVRQKLAEAMSGPPPSSSRPPQPPPLDEGRLRSALAQLARGLLALHAGDKVHRDIKPSNILVTPTGRVVLLDFGLVSDAAPRAGSTDEILQGTVGYMAPEQAGLGRVGPEADWYAVGVLLYVALTGRLPFDGSAVDVLMRKQRQLPPPPSAVAPGVCADLEALCMDLLRIDARARPAGAQVLRRLAERGDRARATSLPPPPPRAAFVGRTCELQVLRACYEEARAGGGATVAVCVLGESGVGKTALVRRFAADAAAEGALVLSGRCYERELVPYKAVDGVIDALCLHLSRLPPDAAASLLPTSAWLLPQLFPVLGRLDAIDAGEPAAGGIEPREARARSFSALRELFVHVAQVQPLVVTIDDLQWADADSLALLGEILRPPDGPRMLLLCTARADGGGRPQLPFPTRDLTLGPLAREEAVELAGDLLERLGTPGAPSAAAIADEAHGHPLFIAELARHARRASGRDLRLDEALRVRVAQLDERARQLVELVAVAGAPIALATAARAIDPSGRGELASCVAMLRAENLVRTARGGGSDRVEAYHDRVREAVLARLDQDTRRAWHERIAQALESARDADPESLAVHWRGAGQPHKAARWALAAAHEAARSLAFERAASLGRMALELVPPDHDDAQRARLVVAEALANAGRGAEAASRYLEAAEHAEHADAADAVELRRLAAEQLLRSGRIDEGLDAMGGVLRAAGLDMPRSPRRAVASLLWNRARLAVRGHGYQVRVPERVPSFALRRIDACWSVTLGLSLVDIVRAADFQARTLRLSLDAGEPARLARSFAMAASFAAGEGGRGRRRAATLLGEAERLAERHDDPYARAWLALVRGTMAFYEGRWREVLAACDEAHRRFRACTNVAWEVASSQAFSLYALGFLGELRELGRRVEAAHRDALDRGDLYAAMNVRTGSSHYVRLAADDPDASRRESSEAMRGWSRRGFHQQHLLDLFTQTETDLYAGESASALARVRERWGALERSQLLRIQINRVIMEDLFARAEIAAARAIGGLARWPLLASARRRARVLERRAMGWSSAMATLLRAGIAAAAGRPARARTLYVRSATMLDGLEMALHAAAARVRAAELHEADAAARERAHAQFVREGVRAPERFARMLAP